MEKKRRLRERIREKLLEPIFQTVSLEILIGEQVLVLACVITQLCRTIYRVSIYVFVGVFVYFFVPNALVSLLN